jgi:hypothetical protein
VALCKEPRSAPGRRALAHYLGRALNGWVSSVRLFGLELSDQLGRAGAVLGKVGCALRLPRDLKADLERWARQDRRSLNAQIEVRRAGRRAEGRGVGGREPDSSGANAPCALRADAPGPVPRLGSNRG